MTIPTHTNGLDANSLNANAVTVKTTVVGKVNVAVDILE